MRLLKIFIWVFSACLFTNGFSQTTIHKTVKKEQSSSPTWIERSNIYEVNVRQYTPEGTFKAFETHLPRLKQMGVEILWFMPIQPIGVRDRKGSLGSYYSVQDYTAVNPEFGTMQEWKALVKKCHEMGFKVIIDWVAYHTAADHPWLTRHPDFYFRDSVGNPIAPFDWTDVRRLNYNNNNLIDSMIASMQYWVSKSGIDGFRCDFAKDVPAEFWEKCIPTLRKTKPLFFLAEGEDPILHRSGFNATYTWSVFNVIKDIAAGKRNAMSLDTIFHTNYSLYGTHALRMYFTSNHDENSWNKADYATTPNFKHAPFAVLTQTLPHTIPLIYSGQEEPVLKSIRFFDKDTISFNKLKRVAFYTKLLHLRKENKALDAGSNFNRLKTNKYLYAFVRQNGDKKVLVVVNLSKSAIPAELNDEILKGNCKEIFTGESLTLAQSVKFVILPWGYKVFEYL